MEIIRSLPETLGCVNPVLTIGNFDGVHRGHQKILRRVVETANDVGGTPVAMTFHPQPVRVLAPERGLKIITPLEDKAALMCRSGISMLICVPFDKDFSRTDADDFIRDVLVRRFGVRWVIVGHSYSFGRGKRGGTALLRRRGKTAGFGVTVVRYATVYGDIVSSSRIRSLLLRGRVCEASQMLGRAYHIEGSVVKGVGRGAPLLGTPTANIVTDNELIPKEGVYAVKVSLVEPERTPPPRSGRSTLSCGEARETPVYGGVANIGINPTFGGEAMSYEVHLFGYCGDLIGSRLRVHFLDRIRDERRFRSIGELKTQIQRDIRKAGLMLARKNTDLYL